MHSSHLGTSLNAVVTEIEQSLSNRYFHFFFIVESATSQVLLFVASDSYPCQELPPNEKQNA
jgi:hypothetical protein